MIDFTPFCSTDLYQPYLHKPFTIGDFSYATDGHVIIRVPKLADAAESDKVATAEKIFAEAGTPECAPLASLTIPEAPPEARCKTCDGRGHEHDCPDCECECWDCEGSGKAEVREKLAIAIAGVPFAARYIRLLLTLPAIRVSRTPVEKRPMPFEFEGGRGVLMPLMFTDKDYEIITASFAAPAQTASEASPQEGS